MSSVVDPGTCRVGRHEFSVFGHNIELVHELWMLGFELEVVKSDKSEGSEGDGKDQWFH